MTRRRHPARCRCGHVTQVRPRSWVRVVESVLASAMQHGDPRPAASLVLLRVPGMRLVDALGAALVRGVGENA